MCVFTESSRALTESNTELGVLSIWLFLFYKPPFTVALIAHKSVFLFFSLQTQQVFRWISVSWGIVQTAATQNLSNTNSKSTPFWSFKFWVPFKFFFRWLFSLFCSVLSCYRQDGRSVRPYQKQNL